MSYVAQRYAQALHEVGCSAETFAEASNFLMETVPLWEALLSPLIHPREKKSVLSALPYFQDKETLLRFFLLLIHNQRLALLPDIAQNYHLMALEDAHASECLMRCVHVPSADQQARLKAKLCALHGKKDIRLLFEISPDLLGGFVLELDGVRYDHSIQGRLHGLAQHLCKE